MQRECLLEKLMKPYKACYGVEVSKDTITRITDKILLEILAWQSRPIDDVCDIMFVDGIRLKVCENGKYAVKSQFILLWE